VHNSLGAKNVPQYSDDGAPADGADLTEVAAYAALMGNYREDVDSVRVGLTGAALFDGLKFYSTDTGVSWLYQVANGWVITGISPAPDLICPLGGTQALTGSFALIAAAYGTPTLNRGFTSFASGVLTAKFAGVYDVIGSLMFAASATQSVVITKNSAAVSGGVVAQQQVTGLTVMAATPVVLAAGDTLRMFGATGGASASPSALSFLSATWRNA
jgi:hypothetical protein